MLCLNPYKMASAQTLLSFLYAYWQNFQIGLQPKYGHLYCELYSYRFGHIDNLSANLYIQLGSL